MKGDNNMIDYPIGQKVEADVLVIGEFEYTDYNFSYYGTTHYIYSFADQEGNVLVWKTSSFMAIGDVGCEGWMPIHKGDKIHLKGTVKEHSEYKGTEQTVLQRCKYSLIEKAPTKEELDEANRKAQIESLAEGDFIWEMPYKQYKEHYSDCETVIGSFRPRKDDVSTIQVIIRNGRLKASGTRGKHYSGYQFQTADGKLVCYRAVSEETAKKQLLKEFPNGAEWKCVKIFDYRYNAHLFP